MHHSLARIAGKIPRTGEKCGLAAFILVGLIAGNAQASSYRLPPENLSIIGQIVVVQARHEDTLADLARRNDVGHNEMVDANPGVDRWIPGEATRIVVPSRYILPTTPREGVVVNLPEMRLYYYPKPKRGEIPQVITHPISVGRMDWATPLGVSRIIGKQKNPSWRPPASIRAEAEERGEPLPAVVPAGPDNPLGDYAMRLSIPGYLIHGTNKPYGVGMRVTHGCIRMYPEDIEALFPEVPVNTQVRLVDEPVKAAVLADTLFLEVHPPLDELPMTEEQAMQVVLREVEQATGETNPDIDLRRIRQIIRQASGIPEAVALRPAG